METASLGMETAKMAKVSLEKVLAQHPRLADLLKSSSVPFADNKMFDIWPCPKCTPGRLRCFGRNKLPNNRLGLGCVFVCDICGHHESRRK